MKITIEVVGGERFYPGTAIVKIDGREHARLRAEESYEIEVRQDYTASFKVKPA